MGSPHITEIDYFECEACSADFREPSFSEGPKTTDPDTGEVKRFELSKCLCPHCLSDKIRPVPK